MTAKLVLTRLTLRRLDSTDAHQVAAGLQNLATPQIGQTTGCLSSACITQTTVRTSITHTATTGDTIPSLPR